MMIGGRGRKEKQTPAGDGDDERWCLEEGFQKRRGLEEGRRFLLPLWALILINSSTESKLKALVLISSLDIY